MSRRVFLKVEVTIAADVEDGVTNMDEVAAHCLGLSTEEVNDVGDVWNQDVQLGPVTVEDSK